MFCSGATNKTMESLYGKQEKKITCKFIEMKRESTQASYSKGLLTFSPQTSGKVNTVCTTS